jgi:hypothetical protein
MLYCGRHFDALCTTLVSSDGGDAGCAASGGPGGCTGSADRAEHERTGSCGKHGVPQWALATLGWQAASGEGAMRTVNRPNLKSDLKRTHPTVVRYSIRWSKLSK